MRLPPVAFNLPSGQISIRPVPMFCSLVDASHISDIITFWIAEGLLSSVNAIDGDGVLIFDFFCIKKIIEN